MHLRTAVKLLSNEHRWQHTLNVLLVHKHGTYDSSTSVYLFPCCLRNVGGVHYAIGWVPAKNKFLPIALNDRRETNILVRFVKKVKAFASKQIEAEQFYESHRTKFIEVDKAVTLIISNPGDLLDDNAFRQAEQSIRSIVRAISSNEPIPFQAFGLLEGVVKRFMLKFPSERATLNTFWNTVRDHYDTFNQRERAMKNRRTVETYKVILQRKNKKALADDQESLEELERFAEEHNMTIEQANELERMKLALVIMCLSEREYATQNELSSVGRRFFSDVLDDNNFVEALMIGMDRGIDENLIEYNKALDMYKINDDGKSIAIKIMEIANKASQS